VWAVGYAASKFVSSRMPKACSSQKATASIPSDWVRGARTGGVYDHGTDEEDDQGTWEILISPRQCPGHGGPVSDLRRRCTCGRGHGRPRTKARTEVGGWRGMTVATADGDEEVGGLNTSHDVGERAALGPDRAKAARADVSFRRAPWPAHRRS
jgi:hypothetical protein